MIYENYIFFSGNNANPTVGCASGLFGGLNGNSNENGGMTSVTSLGSRISQFRHSMRAGSTNGSNNSTSPGNYAQFLQTPLCVSFQTTKNTFGRTRISQFRHSMRASGSTNGSNNSTSPDNYVQFSQAPLSLQNTNNTFGITKIRQFRHSM